jgi:hypothetical protein
MTISDMSLQELLVHYWNKVLFGSSLKLVNAVSDILDRLEDFHSLAKEQEERHNIARFMAEIYRDLLRLADMSRWRLSILPQRKISME